MTRKRIAHMLAVLLILINFTASLLPAARAQQPAVQTGEEKRSEVLAQPHLFQYAAKFICITNIPRTSNATSSVLPGSYVTVVNVHNPNTDTVLFRKKIALTGSSSGEEPGPVSKWIEHKLTADRAFSVGCEQITKEFGITPIHGAEGFLVIESTGSLDVTAVYTAGHRGAEVEGIAVEQVHERVIR
jgi:hypothetical protein